MLENILEFIKNDKFYLPIIYIAVGVIVNSLLVKAIDSISLIKIKGMDKRKNTVIALVKSIAKYVVAVIVIILILGVYGVNTTSLIASLGVVTAIVGLAFQDTIKDFLAGVFLMFDDAYAVGDTVKINGFTGEVIGLGLKTTKIKAYTGEVMILSNSSFTEVINYNLNPSKILINLPVHYNTSIEVLEKVLEEIKIELKKEENVIEMELLGVDSFNDSNFKYAIIITCEAMTHYGVKRKLLGMVKKKFDSTGIIIPYNQIEVHIEK